MRESITKSLIMGGIIGIILFIGQKFGEDIRNCFLNNSNLFWSLILNIVLIIYHYYLKWDLARTKSSRDYYESENQRNEQRNHELWTKLNNRTKRIKR